MVKRSVVMFTGAALLVLLGAIAVYTARPDAPPAKDAPIRIGVALSQSGNLADSAEHFRRGIELWREQVNARGGLLGRPVELVVYDERSDPATAVRLYERLIAYDEVDLLISPFGSASTAASSAVAERHGRVYINAGGASEAIHQRGFRYVFQTAPAASAYIAGIAPFARAQNLRTAAFVARDYPAARDMLRELKGDVGGGGLEILYTEYFPPGTTDFSASIARARRVAPDILISAGYPNEAVEMVRQLRASNYLPKLFIHNGVSIEDFLRSAGADGEYAVGMSTYEPIVSTSGNAEFVRSFRAKYGVAPGYYSAFGFAGVTVLEAAVRKTGSLDQAQLRETLAVLEVETVVGHHRVDPANGGQIGLKGMLVQVRDGAREIIWPEHVATAEAAVPLPQWSR